MSLVGTRPPTLDEWDNHNYFWGRYYKIMEKKAII